MSRILGLDLGQRRIGLALSDPLGWLAFPQGAIPRTQPERDLAAILSLVREEGVERIVVGVPITMRGETGVEAQAALAFRDELARQAGLPVDTWDERLTTVAADRVMREAGTKQAQRKLNRDAVAATLILQAYLDRRRRQVPGNGRGEPVE